MAFYIIQFWSQKSPLDIKSNEFPVLKNWLSMANILNITLNFTQVQFVLNINPFRVTGI